MKVKATTTFAGEITMTEGEIRDVPEGIAAPLIVCGYLSSLEPLPTEAAGESPKQESADEKEKPINEEITEEPAKKTRKAKKSEG